MRLSGKRITQGAVDGFAWVIGLFAAIVGRFQFDLSSVNWTGFFAIAGLAFMLQCLVGYALSLYRGRYRFASFDEVAGVVVSSALVAMSLGTAVALLGGVVVPRASVVLAFPVALCIMLGSRFVVRAIRQRNIRPNHAAAPVVIFGAGSAAEQLITSMKADPFAKYWPVAMLDDDPDRQRLVIDGVRVRGTRDDIAKIAGWTHAEALVVGIARANSQLLRDLTELTTAAGIDLLVIPSVHELPSGSVGVTDVRGIDHSDLLGRVPVETNLDAIAELLHGRRVLITGAGGSIGSELARQVDRLGPAALGMLDRDESALHAVELSIRGAGLLMDENMILADIRDEQRMLEVFDWFRPDVVFHAAALKHLPLLEQNPAEALKTNVVGTLNVLRAAKASGVQTFVNISTDKAADPTSVLGYSKRVTERLTSQFAQQTKRPYVSVRFGNVLGSRGSVLTAFAAQIEKGGPVTVTHPEVSRYFMTIPEAVQLVLQASVLGEGSEVMVLEMGEPVRIADVARQMVARSGKSVEISYTGMRAGEKLHEDLFSADETAVATSHSMVKAVTAPPLSLDAVGLTATSTSPQVTRNQLVLWAGATQTDLSITVQRDRHVRH